MALVNVKPLMTTAYMPSKIAMRTMLMKLRAKMLTTMDKLPPSFITPFQQLDKPLSRRKYYEVVFKPTIDSLKQYYDQLNIDVKNCVDALLRYDQDLFYQDVSGKPCQAYALIFENLSDLLENEKKRKVLDVINKQMGIFVKNILSDSLLFRKQVECFRELCQSIVRSPTTETLSAIYEKWQKTKIQYQAQNLSIYDLMQLRKEKSAVFGISKSPDVLQVCQQIERIMANKLESLLLSLH